MIEDGGRTCGRLLRSRRYHTEDVCGRPDEHNGQHIGMATLEAKSAYHNEYQRRPGSKQRRSHTARERRTRLQEIKLASGCVDCGYRDNPAALDFDHIPERGEKLYSIGSGMARMSEKALLVEIAKCEVRCANCHRIKTVERKQHVGRRT